MRGLRGFLATMLRRVRRLILFAALVFIAASVALVLALRWIEPTYSAVMFQRLLVEGGPQRQDWVDIEDISPYMGLAVVAAEDQLFPQHWGFDTTQIMAAVEQHLDGGRLRGASTITQQVARNLFLWQGRSLFRKALEAWFTGLIEVLWGKRRILEMYLNFAETGERMFGVGIASQAYFARPPSSLTKSQSALIAAVLPNPLTYRVAEPSAYVRDRQRWILNQMRNLGGAAYLDHVMITSSTL